MATLTSVTKHAVFILCDKLTVTTWWFNSILSCSFPDVILADFSSMRSPGLPLSFIFLSGVHDARSFNFWRPGKPAHWKFCIHCPQPHYRQHSCPWTFVTRKTPLIKLPYICWWQVSRSGETCISSVTAWWSHVLLLQRLADLQRRLHIGQHGVSHMYCKYYHTFCF